MKFEWNEQKRKETLLLRGLDFLKSKEAWLDENSVEISTSFYNELRVIRISKLSDNKIYVVVYTMRAEIIRIISFRRASEKYESLYDQK